MSRVLLELREICYTYEDGPFSFDNISLSIHEGERIAVLGGNGAGKSTFFLICNGVLTPCGGSLVYGGNEILPKKRDLMRLREHVGVVFQDPNQQLIGSTVAAEVSFGPMNLKLSRDEVIQRVDESLESMNLLEHRERAPHYLSGGEKKRVSIADILAMRPDIILFDEPTASLDAGGTKMLEAVLAQLSSSGKTLLVSTHDIDFAWRWADRLIVFDNGNLLADSSPEAFFSDETLLRQSGLRRPILYDVAKILVRRCDFPQGFPKSVEELERLLTAETK